jgi:hypothetical protein
MLHIIPSGIFEAANPETRWSIETTVWRELLEELYDEEEQQGTGFPAYEYHIPSKRPINLLLEMIKEGSAEFTVTGIFCDLLQLRPEISTLLYVKDDRFAKAREISVNWEYERWTWETEAVGSTRIPWDDVDTVIDKAEPGHGLCPGGAAGLSLGRDWLWRRYSI